MSADLVAVERARLCAELDERQRYREEARKAKPRKPKPKPAEPRPTKTILRDLVEAGDTRFGREIDWQRFHRLEREMDRAVEME